MEKVTRGQVEINETVGERSVLKSVLDQAKSVANAESAVLIVGEDEYRMLWRANPRSR